MRLTLSCSFSCQHVSATPRVPCVLSAPHQVGSAPALISLVIPVIAACLEHGFGPIGCSGVWNNHLLSPHGLMALSFPAECHCHTEGPLVPSVAL